MKSRLTTYILHGAVWIILFCSPLMYVSNDNPFNINRFLFFCMSPLMMAVVFYVNYLWLTPKYFAEGKHDYHIAINVIMIVVLGIALHYWMELGHTIFDDRPDNPPPPKHRPFQFDFFFILRDIFNMAMAAIIATTLCLAQRWHDSENARQAAEQERTKAELNNLRSQMNPHFLLNTLNNIYALTAFDPTRAQTAIEQLSRLLRHMLYENEGHVALKKEVEFLNDYVSLMRIRLTSNVSVDFTVDIPNGCQATIAPLIFISLVENAFKHGVSPTEKSYIRIAINADNDHVECEITNSNFPKTSADHSGHGIGLQQVAKRLEITYHGRYQWDKGVRNDGKEYYSKIRIEAKNDI